MSPTARSAVLASLIALSAFWLPAPVAGVALALLAVAMGVDATLIRRPPTVDRVVPKSAARGVPAIRWGHGAAGKVVLKDCHVPAGDVLGGDNQTVARAYAMRVAPLLAAANIGIGQVAFDAAIDYTKLRRQGGKKTIEHQAIGTLLADIAIKLEAARNMVWKAAWVLDHPDAVYERIRRHARRRARAKTWRRKLCAKFLPRCCETARCHTRAAERVHHLAQF